MPRVYKTVLFFFHQSHYHSAVFQITVVQSQTVARACDKRPVAYTQFEKIADEIEQELQSSLEREVSTVDIGEMVMKRLKDIDEVAYVRFASVYRSFKDINTFMDELSKLLSDKN